MTAGRCGSKPDLQSCESVCLGCIDAMTLSHSVSSFVKDVIHAVPKAVGITFLIVAGLFVPAFIALLVATVVHHAR